MRYYPNRNDWSRKVGFGKHKKPFYLLLLNLWLIYLIVLSSSFISEGTYSYYNDTEKIEGVISTLDNFCKDSEYAKKYSEVCKCQELVPVNDSITATYPEITEPLKNIEEFDENQVNNQISLNPNPNTIKEETEEKESEASEVTTNGPLENENPEGEVSTTQQGEIQQ